MAELTLSYPTRESANLKEEVKDLKDRFVMVIKELEYVMNHLDEENVMRAASVRAEDIDTARAKIKDAQIQSLTADKLTAGTIDAQVIRVENIDAGSINAGTLNTSVVDVSSENGRLSIADSMIVLTDKSGTVRMEMGLDTRRTVGGEKNPYYNKFHFALCDEKGNGSIYFDDSGDAVFAGTINTMEDAKIGEKLIINGNNFLSGISWVQDGREVARIDVDSATKAMFLQAGGGIYANGRQVATQEYVDNAIAGGRQV